MLIEDNLPALTMACPKSVKPRVTAERVDVSRVSSLPAVGVPWKLVWATYEIFTVAFGVREPNVKNGPQVVLSRRLESQEETAACKGEFGTATTLTSIIAFVAQVGKTAARLAGWVQADKEGTAKHENRTAQNTRNFFTATSLPLALRSRRVRGRGMLRRRSPRTVG